MQYFPTALQELADQFARLPGIGGKTAQRLAFHVLSLSQPEAQAFADAILNGGAAPVPTSQIYYNQAIISGIVKSAELGREIEMDIPRFEEI